MPAIHAAGRTAIRNAYAGIVTHVGVATDQTAFGDSQTALDPANAGAANLLIKSATKNNVNGNTFDATITIDGSTEFTGKTIWTIGNQSGSARTNNLTRTVRTQGIGVQAGDSFVVGTRNTVSDQT